MKDEVFPLKIPLKIFLNFTIICQIIWQNLWTRQRVANRPGRQNAANDKWREPSVWLRADLVHLAGVARGHCPHEGGKAGRHFPRLSPNQVHRPRRAATEVHCLWRLVTYVTNLPSYYCRIHSWSNDAFRKIQLELFFIFRFLKLWTNRCRSPFPLRRRRPKTNRRRPSIRPIRFTN